ncbi:MAG: excisionase family DNA-binding protein [Elusimicrobiales bacterium]|nr:excisionase family DNA-binding protein [Elusimicrobiales bacterium]
MGREYFSIPEAAARLGLSRIAVFKRVKKGQLEALRFGRNWAVPAAALEKAAAPEKAAVQPKTILPQPRKAAPITAPAAKTSPSPAPDSEMDSMGWD